MRLDEEQAHYLEGMLRSRRYVLVVWRRGTIEGTVDGDYEAVHKEIRFIDRMLGELDRIYTEKGWRSGQSK